MKTTKQNKETLAAVAEEAGIDLDDLIAGIEAGEKDFTIGDYRFIKESDIDRIQQEELSGDPYILGCFNDWFIADYTDLSLEIVQALQSAEKFEAIGQYIIDNDLVDDIQSAYSSLDGYGHHFARYDSETHEELLHLGYYYFRN